MSFRQNPKPNDQNLINRFISSREEENVNYKPSPMVNLLKSSNLNISSSSNKIEQQNLFDREPLNYIQQNNIFSGNQLKMSMRNPDPQPQVYETYTQVRIKSSDKEDWVKELKLTLITHFVGSNKMIINLNLTDEADPLFLYSIDFTETEFLNLKTNQNLLIDFQQFPHKLFELLDKCIRIDDNNLTKTINFSGSSYFQAIFRSNSVNESEFIIEECNNFRRISHLSLLLTQASDPKLKKYLSRLVIDYKEKYEDFLKENNKLKDNLEITTNQFKDFGDQMFSIKERHQIEIESLKNELKRESNDLMEKLLNENEVKLQNKESEKNQIINNQQEKISSLESELSKISKAKIILEKEFENLQENFKDLTMKFELNKKELTIYKEENENLKSANRALDQTKFNQEKNITEFNFKNELILKQIEEKDLNIKSLQSLIETLQGQKLENDDLIKSLKATNNKLEDKLSSSISEINKGNEIIKKLQSDFKKQKALTKAKSELIEQNEKEKETKNQLLSDLNRQINEWRTQSDKKDEENKKNKEEIENLKGKLLESQKIIESNNEMIRYLNDCINQSYGPYKNFSNILNYNAVSTTQKIDFGLNSIRKQGPSLGGDQIPGFTNFKTEAQNYELSNNLNDIKAKNNVISQLNNDYQMNNMYNTQMSQLSQKNNNPEEQKSNVDEIYLMPVTNFTKMKNDTISSLGIGNTNFFENKNNFNNKYGDSNAFQNLNTIKSNYNQENNLTSSIKGNSGSLMSQKYGNPIKLNSYLSGNNEFNEDEELPRPGLKK